MKKLILTILLSFCVAWPAFALNQTKAMRFLLINSLMQYGQTLYDRGDYAGAFSVFNHVLLYDKHETQALYFLKQMGYEPNVNKVLMQPSNTPSLKVMENFDAQSLQQAIDAKRQSIDRLQNQIKQLRENLADPLPQE